MINVEFDSFDEDLTVVGFPSYQAVTTSDYAESSTISRDRQGIGNGWLMALNVQFFPFIFTRYGSMTSYLRTGPEGGPQMSREIVFIPGITGADPAQYASPPLPGFDASAIPLSTVVTVLCKDLLVADFIAPPNLGGTLQWEIFQLPFKWEVVRTNVAAPNDVFTIWDASINPAGPVPNDALFSASTFPNGNVSVGSVRTFHSLRASYFLGHMFYFRIITAFQNIFQLDGGELFPPVYPETVPMPGD